MQAYVQYVLTPQVRFGSSASLLLGVLIARGQFKVISIRQCTWPAALLGRDSPMSAAVRFALTTARRRLFRDMSINILAVPSAQRVAAHDSGSQPKPYPGPDGRCRPKA